MDYIIDGPVNIGTATQATGIKGNVTLVDVTTAAGDMVYSDGSNLITKLPLTTNGVMIGGASAPSWLGPGTSGFVLTMVGTTPAWAVSQSDSSLYGFMSFKSGDQAPISATETVITTWDVPAADPEYDSTGGAFVPATGVFTVPGALADKSRWRVNAGISFTQSSNNNTLVTDVHQIRVMLNNATVIGSCLMQPGPRNGNITTLFATIDINFEAKGTDIITVDAACKNGGNITIKGGAVTWYGITKLSNV